MTYVGINCPLYLNWKKSSIIGYRSVKIYSARRSNKKRISYLNEGIQNAVI